MLQNGYFNAGHCVTDGIIVLTTIAFKQCSASIFLTGLLVCVNSGSSNKPYAFKFGISKILITSCPIDANPTIDPYCVVKGFKGSRNARSSVFVTRGCSVW